MNLESAITAINELTPVRLNPPQITKCLKEDGFYKIESVGMARSIEIHALNDSLHIILETESGSQWEKFIK